MKIILLIVIIWALTKVVRYFRAFLTGAASMHIFEHHYRR